MAAKNREQLEKLASIVESLHGGGKYSDFTIRCSDNSIIRAHRAIVCPRSSVISAELDGEFEEAFTREINIKDDEPLIVAKMIDYMYLLDYDDHRHAIESERLQSLSNGTSSKDNHERRSVSEDVPEEPSKYDEPEAFDEQVLDEVFRTQVGKEPVKERSAEFNPYSLLVNAKVYIIGEIYDIQPLKDWAVTKYEEVLPQTWNSTAFVESAGFVLDGILERESDRKLRDVIVAKASANCKELLDRSEFVKLLNSHGDFAVEVLKHRVQNHQCVAETRPVIDPLPEPVDDDWGFSFNSTRKKCKKCGRS